MSQLKTYYLHAWVRGVEPTPPGFATVRVRPYLGTLQKASGSVPTPHGFIVVTIDRDGDAIHLQIKAPDAIKVEIAAWPEFPVRSATVNGKRVF